MRLTVCVGVSMVRRWVVLWYPSLRNLSGNAISALESADLDQMPATKLIQ